MKKPLNVLSKTALAAVLAGTAIIPVMSVQAAETQSIEEVLVEQDGKIYSLSYEMFNDLSGEGHVFSIKHVVTGGKTFTADDFNEAFGESDNVEEALQSLETNYTPVDVTVSGTVELDENGEPVYKDEVTEEALVVESVSAINNATYEFQVTFNQEIETAKDATLTLGDLSFVANATKTEGNVATYTINNDDHGKLVTGNYTIAIDGVDVSGNTVNYEKLVTETGIMGVAVEDFETVAGTPDAVVDADLAKNHIAGVTVKVDKEVTATNGFGYYNIPNIQPGLKEVTYSKPGYFTQRVPVTTKRTNETSHLVEMVQRDEDKYAIEGTMLDAETSRPVVDDVTVTLQKSVNGAWVDVEDALGVAFTADTVDGKFAFINSTAKKDAGVTADAAATTDVHGALKHTEDGSAKYRVVANKAVASNSFTDVYVDQASKEITLSDEKATTTPAAIKVTKVKEIKDINFNATWADLADKTATDLKFTFIGTNGEEELVLETTESAVKVAGEAILKDEEAINLVDKELFGQGINPRLPIGTYFLKVDDAVTANAVAYVPVQVTEEGQVIDLSAEITESANLTPAVAVPTIKYNAVFGLTDGTSDATDLKTASATDFDATTEIATDVKTFLHIDGGKVLVDDTAGATKFDYDATSKAITASVDKIDRLPGGTYSVTTADGNYVTEAEAGNVTLNTGGSTNKTVDVAALASTKVKVSGSDTSGTALGVNLITTVELIDAKTNKVVATNTAIRDVVTGLVTTGASTDFLKVTPGEYKVRAAATGYEAKTSDKFTIMDFQELVDTPALVLKANPNAVDPAVQGIALFTDDNSAAEDAVVTAYDKDGKIVGTEDVDTDGTYAFANLTKGDTYKLVLRQDGKAETVDHEVTVPTENGAVKTVDFDVVKGGEAQYEVIIVDSKDRKVDLNLDASDVTGANAGKPVVYITDEWATAPTVAPVVGQPEAIDFTALETAITTTTDDGIVGLTAQGTPNLYATTADLSAGAYNVVITDGADTKEYAATVTIQKGATVDGGIIKLQLKDSADGALTYDVDGAVAGATVNSGYVLALAKDESGKEVVVASSRITTAGAYKLEALPNNTAYRLVTVENGKFVAQKTVTVQDRNVTGQDMTVVNAIR